MSERKLLFMMHAEQALAFARLMEAANRGDGDAACRLGDMYREALGGLRYSPKQAHRWYARSAMAGDPNGQNNLGACYEHGLGCAQSYAKAAKWYRLAAAQGLAYASSNLAYLYLRGHGVPADKSTALGWFEKAFAQGDERAEEMVKQLGGAAPSKPKVRIVDRTVPGQHFGIVGTDGMRPPRPAPWEDEDLRLELLNVLRSGEFGGEVQLNETGEAPEAELFPIYVECGMVPDDFEEGTARRYGEYLQWRKQE